MTFGGGPGASHPGRIAPSRTGADTDPIATSARSRRKRRHLSEYRSQKEWCGLSDLDRLKCLRFEQDQQEVAAVVAAAVGEAGEGFANSFWSKRGGGGTLTGDELGLYRAGIDRARDDARQRAWDGLRAADGARCRHGSRPDGCMIVDCPNAWRKQLPSAARYATGELRTFVLERDHWTCQRCGRAVRDGLPSDHPDRANVDHIIPYPAGRTRIDNLQVLCSGCNRLKGNSMPPVEVELPLD